MVSGTVNPDRLECGAGVEPGPGKISYRILMSRVATGPLPERDPRHENPPVFWAFWIMIDADVAGVGQGWWFSAHDPSALLQLR
jgi:hypothetical protein